MLFELRIQTIEHNAWFHRGSAPRDIDVKKPAQILRVVDDQGRAGGLSTLARAGTAGKYGNAKFTSDVDRNRDVAIRSGDKDTQRHNLID